MRFAVAAVRASALLLGITSVGPTTLRTFVLLSPPAMLAFTGLVVAATFLDIRITGERILYANLAIRRAHIATIAMIVSVVLEAATILLLGVIWRP